jgi:hypothetical protein
MQKASTLKRTIVYSMAAILTLGTIATVPVAAQGKNAVTALQIPVAGTSSSGPFAGTATITGFMVSGKNVVATGTISGLVNGTQSVVASFAAPVTLPSSTGAAPVQAQASSSCEILNLVIGPIDLNLLGLTVSIPNPIVVNITAVPGAGNLLGNLLCDVANLLNGGGALQQIANELNQILSILNGL